MRQRVMMLAALVAAVVGLAACSSVSGGAPWREATKLVLGEGTTSVQTTEGEALREYLRTFEPDARTGFRLVHDTRTGYIMIQGARYLVTAAREKEAPGRELLTIHAGSQPLHLKQR